jgi:hypothetical protein
MQFQIWIVWRSARVESFERKHTVHNIRSAAYLSILARAATRVLGRPKWIAFREQRRSNRGFPQHTMLRPGE